MERIINGLRLGLTAALLLGLSACSSSGDGESSGVVVRKFPDVTPYASSSPWAAVMKDCVNASGTAESCKIADLPPIGYNNANPTVADVMDRVLVSHTWMGQRFEAMLNRLPNDMLTLMRSVTVVVIDKNIRPSYYWAVTGAIHLDPAYLWLTNAEKADVALDADYRSDFGKDLKFEFFSRYLKNGVYAWDYFSLTNDTERSEADIEYNLARLLYHELAHANDYMPAIQLSQLNSSNSFFTEVDKLYQAEQLNFQALESFSDLQNSSLDELAQVRFQTGTATASQQLITAEVIGAEFASEGAAHFYSYYTSREDLAMLFEATQLKRHYGIDSEIAIVVKPTVTDANCGNSDWLIGWGEQRRLGSPLVDPRARYASTLLLPNEDLSDFFDGLSASSLTTQYTDWCDLRPNFRSFGPSIDPVEWQRANAHDPRHLIDLH